MKNDIASVSPALEKYSKTALAELWSRPGLSHRDRSLATVAALIVGHRATELPHQMELALAARVLRRLAQRVFGATGGE